MQREPAVLTLNLDPERLARLERAAAEQMLSLDAYIMSLLDKSLQIPEKDSRRIKGARSAGRATLASKAPLDAFLPEGADPFLRDDANGTEQLSFNDLQAHLRFAGCGGLSR